MTLAKWVGEWEREAAHWHNLDGYFKPVVTRFFITWFATAPMISSLSVKYPELFTLPFNWWILWLASFFYAIAFGLHALQCPLFIKRYPTFLAYEGRGHSPRWLVWEFSSCWRGISKESQLKLAKRVIEKSYATEASDAPEARTLPLVRSDGTIFQFEYEKKIYEVSVHENAEKATERDIFWEIFGRWTTSRFGTRTCIWLLLAGAITLVVWTVLENVYFVGALLWAQV